jgi:hypothetical protein
VHRTLLYKHDLDWLPKSFKVLRWTVAGGVWTGMAALLGGVAVFTHGSSSGVIGSMAKGLFVGGLVAGDRTARSVLRRRLAKLAHGQVELSRLQHQADGELVHVRGRVRAREHGPGLLDANAQTVYRRVLMNFSEVRVVHEAAVDFELVDDKGESIIVEVEGAHLIAPELKLQRLQQNAPAIERLLKLELPEKTRYWQITRARKLAKGKKPPPVSAAEYLLREGDEVEVVGFKNRTVDVSVESRLARDTPLRATLRAGRELPLILSPANE